MTEVKDELWIDWDDELFENNISHAGNLLEYLLEKNPKEMIPNVAPTRLDLIQFKSNLVEALAKCEGAVGLIGGHAYLVLTNAEFQRWIGDPQIPVPTKPVIPPIPDKVEDMTLANAFYINRAERALSLHRKYEQQTKHVLETKFPNGTIGIRDYNGNVPHRITALTILEYISSKTLF